jgi:hypothetical protein
VSQLRAAYDVVLATMNAVVIVDTGHVEGLRTVTNDAEAVVADLASQVSVTGGLAPSYGEDAGGSLGARRLFYIDSSNRMDELLHDGRGKFTGFAPL